MKVNNAIYLPGLNGIRAIAALAVVVSHTTLALGEFNLDSAIFGKDKAGNPVGLFLAGHAVTIFFVLSGFLITFLTLIEKEQAGSLNTKKFYFRRILRIWPLYYAYLIVSLVLIYIFKLPDENMNQLPFFIFLMANIPFIFAKSLPLIPHYWSLGVEEQYYLFFPQIAKLSVKKMFYSFIIIGGVLWLLKIVFWVLQSRSLLFTTFYQFLLVTRFYSMFLGGIGAILFYKNNALFIKLFTNKVVQIVSWVIIGLLAFNKFHFASVIDSEIVAVVSVALIFGQITKKGLLNLEKPIFDFLGKILYGIYVIHPAIILLISRMLYLKTHSWYNYVFIYLIVLLFTILIAYLSYEYFEKKFLKIKGKFSVVHSKSSNK